MEFTDIHEYLVLQKKIEKPSTSSEEHTFKQNLSNVIENVEESMQEYPQTAAQSIAKLTIAQECLHKRSEIDKPISVNDEEYNFIENITISTENIAEEKEEGHVEFSITQNYQRTQSKTNERLICSEEHTYAKNRNSIIENIKEEIQENQIATTSAQKNLQIQSRIDDNQVVITTSNLLENAEAQTSPVDSTALQKYVQIQKIEKDALTTNEHILIQNTSSMTGVTKDTQAMPVESTVMQGYLPLNKKRDEASLNDSTQYIFMHNADNMREDIKAQAHDSRVKSSVAQKDLQLHSKVIEEARTKSKEQNFAQNAGDLPETTEKKTQESQINSPVVQECVQMQKKIDNESSGRSEWCILMQNTNNANIVSKKMQECPAESTSAQEHDTEIQGSQSSEFSDLPEYSDIQKKIEHILACSEESEKENLNQEIIEQPTAAQDDSKIQRTCEELVLSQQETSKIDQEMSKYHINLIATLKQCEIQDNLSVVKDKMGKKSLIITPNETQNKPTIHVKKEINKEVEKVGNEAVIIHQLQKTIKQEVLEIENEPDAMHHILQNSANETFHEKVLKVKNETQVMLDKLHIEKELSKMYRRLFAAQSNCKMYHLDKQNPKTAINPVVQKHPKIQIIKPKEEPAAGNSGKRIPKKKPLLDLGDVPFAGFKRSSKEKTPSNLIESKDNISLLKTANENSQNLMRCASPKDEKPYKCPHCNFASQKEYGLRLHMRSHTKPFWCGACSEKFQQIAALQQHVSKHHYDQTGKRSFKLYRCGVCDYASSSPRRLLSHMQTHQRERLHKCSKCRFSAMSKLVLQRHEMEHTKPQQFECAECGYITVYLNQLQAHQQIHGGPQEFQCSQCAFITTHPGYFQAHQMLHNTCLPKKEEGVQELRCQHCDYCTKEQAALVGHARNFGHELPVAMQAWQGRCKIKEEPDRPYKNHLNRAGRKYSDKTLKQLVDEKPFKCNLCEFITEDKHEIKVHNKRHFRKRPPDSCLTLQNLRECSAKRQLLNNKQNLFKLIDDS